MQEMQEMVAHDLSRDMLHQVLDHCDPCTYYRCLLTGSAFHPVHQTQQQWQAKYYFTHVGCPVCLRPLPPRALQIWYSNEGRNAPSNPLSGPGLWTLHNSMALRERFWGREAGCRFLCSACEVEQCRCREEILCEDDRPICFTCAQQVTAYIRSDDDDNHNLE